MAPNEVKQAVATDSSLSGNAELGAEPRQFDVLARNVLTNYVALGVEMVVGLLVLPFNISHLGKSAYGLWVLTASITLYFSMFDLGYGDAQVKFAAQYRARRDHAALNQVVSTLFFIFSGVGLITYVIAIIIAFNLNHLFNLTTEQATTGRQVLLVASTYVALGFPFSVFGGIVNGFQRHYVNGVVAITTTIVAAAVNVAVLLAGYGLVGLVCATTTVRILSYFAYRINAYRVFPGLRVRLSYFSFDRLREVTGFSVYLLIIDLANKLNYSTDTIVIGIFMNTGAIAVWSVAQRLADTTQRLTGQLNAVLFPVVVDSATAGEADRLRLIFIQGTRLSLAMVILIATGLIALAQQVVLVWVGPQFIQSVTIIYLLALVVTVRVGNSTATTLLKGAGRHRLLAFSNIAIAIANVILSCLLVRRYGLVGVALGTLIPLSAISIFVLFPAACRRVDLSVVSAMTKAFVPAIWPALIVAAFLVGARNLVTQSLITIGAESFIASLLYIAMFVGVALPRAERQWYLRKLIGLIRPRRIATIGGEAESIGIL